MFGDASLKDSNNPYAAPMQGGTPPQPTDQSGMASSLGVVSIVVGSVSLVFGFCCCPIGAVGSVIALGLGIWGWIVANNQLKQTKYAPYLRHLEPPAKTALILCIIGTAISGLATLLVGGSLLFMIISGLVNAP